MRRKLRHSVLRTPIQLHHSTLHLTPNPQQPPMKTLKQTALFQLALALFLWASTAAAQMNTIGVTLYSECNYAGASAGIPAVGNYYTNYLLALGLPSDNTISSLRVAPGYEVVLFDGDNYTGDSITVTANTDCLVARGWDNRASSLKVRAAATLYRDCNYAGVTAPLPVGNYTASALQRLGIASNNLSSLRVRRGYEVVLFDGDNFTGPSITIKANNACLVAQGWDNRASSLRVQPAAPAPARRVATFYRDCDLGGLGVPLEVGNYTTRQLEDRYIRNNDVSSINVEDGYEVEIFDGDNFTGESRVITGLYDCLVPFNWNDRISSLKVRVATPPPAEVAALYYDCDLGGASLSLPVGDYSWRDLFFRLDSLSSFKISDGYEIVLFAGDNFTGDSRTFTGFYDCLVPFGWNDRTLSLKIRVATPPPPPPLRVAFFATNCAFPNSTIPLEVGDYTSRDLINRFVNPDRINGLRVNAGYEVVLFDGDNFTGPSITRRNTAFDCLTDDGWGNRASSLKIRAVAPNSVLTLSPNPATSTISLGGLTSFPATVGVYDGQGTLRKTLRLTQPSQQVTLDCAGLESGLYLIRVEDAQGVRTQRLDKR